MRRIISTEQIRRLLSAQEGATAIEYALIAAGVAAAIVAGVTALGGSVGDMWTHVGNIFS